MALKLNTTARATWRWVSDSDKDAFIEGVKPTRNQRDSLMRKHTSRDGDIKILAYNSAILADCITNWGGFVDENDNEIAFSKDGVEQLVTLLANQGSNIVVECVNLMTRLEGAKNDEDEASPLT